MTWPYWAAAGWAVIAFGLFIIVTRNETTNNFRRTGNAKVQLEGFTATMCAAWPVLLVFAALLAPCIGAQKLVERMCLPAEVRKARRKNA